jgi:hypothetical protein
MNRTTLANGNTSIEEFAASARRAIGSVVDLPMNAFGSVAKLFVVVGVQVNGNMVAYELAAK